MKSSQQRLPLTALRSFEAAARLLSFKAAAEELRVTPTSVSNQIRQLELDWGCLLFVRKTRKVFLTDAGRSLARVMSRAFDDIRAEVETHISTNRKTVTLAVGPIFGARWLIPRLSKFYRLNPNIELVLHHSPRITNAEQLVATIAVDWGIGDWQGLDAHRLLDVIYRPVLSPALLFRTMSVVHLEQLDFRPVAMYFVCAALLFVAVLVWQGLNRRAIDVKFHGRLLFFAQA
jgi:LysR family glycine cleavage system transcriptional activator